MGEDQSDAMFDLAEELRKRVDDPDGVSSGRLDGGRAYVVPAETEAEADEIADWDVDATDETEVVQTRAVDTEYGVAFKVEE
ncbi:MULTISPECIES: hypothetical protein [Halorussus]|uniref:hypothetical protein n=1 Tax=Halorussus TaxID=1070314 RepID=UPI0013B35B49|nr:MULTISPECIES: hypothetical protein [Halorussus]NHN60439.1 hypothetical protein [Halorussus sp. JP-T4]